MQAVLDTESLHAAGLKIIELFNHLKAGAASTHVSFETEVDRFELWSINLGLFVAGHGSLDYRLGGGLKACGKQSRHSWIV